MAPIISKSGRTGITKTVNRRKQSRKEQSFDDSDDEQLFAPHSLINGTSDHEIVDLHDIAERVGKEVDVFAETLDQFKEQLQSPDTQREAALQLCTSYRDYAVDQVKRLKKQHQVQRMQEMRDNFAKRAQSSLLSRRGSISSATTAGDPGLKTLKQWQAEADTWDLMRVILKARYPSQLEVTARNARLEEIGQPHRYTSHDELWQRFVLDNDVAKERHLILRWLEQAADHDTDEVKTLAEELERKAGRSGGMWTNGWMETRERIKGAKRMRFGNNSTLDVRRSDSTDLLVSSLDPDAPARQKRTLEKGDAISERSMWITCYEMLRRGKTWSEICEWCAERNQGWKVLSMGMAATRELPVGTAGPASGALWRRMCLVAAHSDTADDYEAAVYGLLGGDLDTVKKVCRNWNDHVFAHLNNLLMAQYDQYILQLGSLQLPLEFVRKHGLSVGAPGETAKDAAASSRTLVQSLAKLPTTSEEAHSPMKLLHGSLIGGDLLELCIRIGTAIAHAAWKDEPSAVIRPVDRLAQHQGAEALPEAAISDDPDALRIIAHILVIMRALEHSTFADSNRDELDNIIAGYIQLLRVAGKRDMTPLYASLMANDRCVASLAQVIADDQDPKDSMDFIRLMQIYNIDAIAVIKGQYVFQLDRALATSASSEKFVMLEDTKEDLYPGRRIKLGGINNAVTPDEEALVSGLSVFYLVEGHWTVTFGALASACGKLLAEGHFAAARLLVEQLQFEQLSISKSKNLLGRPINVTDPAQIVSVSDTAERVFQLQVMQRESQKYYDMTLLVRAVQALESWRKVEHEFATKIPRPSTTPVKVRKAVEEVTVCMEPLLAGILVDSKDEAEASTFARIKSQYLPEIILAYITVLCTAAHMVSRDELLTAMDLATVIATNERNGITRAFLDAGRMKELVTMFAETSKIMLKLGETGKPRREKKSGGGRNLGIWEIYG